jgi:hypothetical protein
MSFVVAPYPVSVIDYPVYSVYRPTYYTPLYTHSVLDSALRRSRLEG